jgi:acetyl-CoA carboxylase carboxyltransferase component
LWFGNDGIKVTATPDRCGGNVTAIGTPLKSRLATRSDEYRANLAAMQELWDQVAVELARVPTAGGQRYVDRHRKRGKLLVRERIEALIDPHTPFLELSPLAAWGTQDPVGAGVVTGIGIVEGVEVAITGSDITYRGGSVNPTTLTKATRFYEIVKDNRLPTIILNEAAGADLTRQADIFVPGGAQFRQLTQMSKLGIPTITIGFGPATAGGAYVPGMSDYTIFVKGRGTAYLGGPPLVKMAIDEDADEEDLGGAEMHSRISGLSDYLAVDELDALRMARGIVRHLGWRKLGPGATEPIDEPLYPADELPGCASADVRVPFDVREVFARVFDGSRFEEFKPLYGSRLVCGWASICGFRVGVLGNNGILFSEEAKKGAQFIQLCNRSDTPIVFFQNITGFMVGTKAEQGGIIRNGAKLINAVSNSEVPHLVVMVGASYGAGNYGMSGRAYNPRFIFTWPNHRIAVMGPKQLAGVMDIVARASAAKRGLEIDDDALAMQTSMLESQVEKESTALYATGRVWDDGIIHPSDTRTVLGMALSAVHSNEVKGATEYGVWRH